MLAVKSVAKGLERGRRLTGSISEGQARFQRQISEGPISEGPISEGQAHRTQRDWQIGRANRTREELRSSKVIPAPGVLAYLASGDEITHAILDAAEIATERHYRLPDG